MSKAGNLAAVLLILVTAMAERVGVASAELGCAAISDGAFLGSPLCTLVIPNSLLLRLYEEEKELLEGVNSCITGGLLSLDPTCSRLKNVLRKASSRLHCRKRNCKGSRDRARLREGVTHVLVGEGETLTVRGLQEDLQRKEVDYTSLLCYMMKELQREYIHVNNSQEKYKC